MIFSIVLIWSECDIIPHIHTGGEEPELWLSPLTILQFSEAPVCLHEVGGRSSSEQPPPPQSPRPPPPWGHRRASSFSSVSSSPHPRWLHKLASESCHTDFRGDISQTLTDSTSLKVGGKSHPQREEDDREREMKRER